MNNYDAETVTSLDYFEHIRQYPGMYIGSKDSNGLHHLVKEIISNSIDEYLNGAGDTILVKLQKDGGIYVEDNGRGIPLGEHSKGISTLRACYGVAHTGGKFNNATGVTGYNTSGGEHGTGLKAVNALSTKLIATTTRDGIKETVEFSKGKFISTKKEKKTGHGVSTLFYPDNEVLEEIKFDSNRIRTMIQEFSYLCSGLKFIYEDEIKGSKEEFYSENGLSDFINYLNKGKPFLFDPIYFSNNEGNFQVEAIVGYNGSYGNNVKLYTNNIPQEKGTHLTGFKTAWTSGLNQFAREKGWLKEKDENLAGSDYEEGQILILNFKMIDPVFKGQNKEELSSSEGRVIVQKLTSQALKDYCIIHEKDIKIIIDRALNARKAREAAKKARDTVRGIEKKKEKVVKVDSKLADCSSKNRKECEIYIVEGDSASGNLKMARDNKTQAVMPLRGKVLNVQKASLSAIQKNKEIMSMIQAFGLKVDPKTMKLTYDKDELRYGKIIIMSDADVDGAHIKNLFYTFIWNFCPQLIEEGYVYAGVPPLYKITEGNGKNYVYLKNDEELEEYRNKNKGKKYIINRFKGLGEMNAEATEETLTDKENRIIKKITVEDAKATDKLFEDLMGTGVTARKEFIKERSKDAGQYNAE